MSLEEKEATIDGEEVEQGDTLVTLRECNHGDFKTVIQKPDKYTDLPKGTEVTFIRKFRNLHGTWARVKDSRGITYDLRPYHLTTKSKEEEDDYIWIPRSKTDEYGWVYLPEYAGSTKTEVKGNILSEAIDKESYTGPADKRIEELGWEIVKTKIIVVGS